MTLQPIAANHAEPSTPAVARRGAQTEEVPWTTRGICVSSVQTKQFVGPVTTDPNCTRAHRVLTTHGSVWLCRHESEQDVTRAYAWETKTPDCVKERPQVRSKSLSVTEQSME